MKKIVFIVALFITVLAVESCCVTATCPGVAEVELPHSES